MHIRGTLSRSFLLVDGLRSVEQARELLRQTGPRYLVVTAGEAPDHYLFAAAGFEARVASAEPTAALQDSGLLRGARPAPVVVPVAGEPVGEPSLVFEAGMLAGIYATRHARKGTGALFAGSRPRDGEGDADGSAQPRYLKATLPKKVAVGDVVVLAVELGAEDSTLRVGLAGGSELDVVVQAREGFAVEGSGSGTLRVPSDGPAARAEFRLRAQSAGTGLVRVYAFHDGGAVGSLTLRPVIRPARVGVAAPASALPLSGAGGLADATQPSLADLSLLILEERVDGRPVLRIRVTARNADLGLNLKEFGPVVLRLEPVEYFGHFFTGIEELGKLDAGSAEMVRRKLEARGARLYESIFPGALRALLWDYRDRIGSIHIQSDEAWIPWELCRLTGTSEGAVVEDRFFCEAFEITRWIPGIARRPRLTLNNLAVVAPRDSRLRFVREELAFVSSLAGGGKSVSEVPARYVDVRSAFAAGTFDWFHFCGHGILRSPDPDRSAITLEGADELRADEISGVLQNLGRARPVVFLNSCHGARGAFTLAGTGGWARRYLDAGASAFVGAYWSVSDEAACGFAQAFYREVCAGKPLGAAVRAARLAIRTPNDPTWLAYTVFGDSAAALGR